VNARKGETVSGFVGLEFLWWACFCDGQMVIPNFRQPLGFLQNWRLTEAEIDGFCRVWYDGIVDQHGSCGTNQKV